MDKNVIMIIPIFNWKAHFRKMWELVLEYEDWTNCLLRQSPERNFFGDLKLISFFNVEIDAKMVLQTSSFDFKTM